MNKTRIATLIASAALIAAAAACGGDSTTNTTTRNANNANVAVVNNNGNANTSGVATTNTSTTTTTTNTNTNYNMTREEYDKDDVNYRKRAKDAGDSIGTTVADGWIHLKTRGALAAVDDLEDSNINVDVEDGVITLRGSVPTQAQVTAADKAAKGIEGKKSVKNMLKVGGADANKNANANANAKGTANK
ncbi:MAG TPA: BON domain-containing protein [Pyrinomonadaceae bacterium]|jgi:hypothetical protein